MRRSAALAMATAVLASAGGCRSRPAQLDPFMGRTTVPPPATGSVGGGAPAYTYPAAPPSLVAPPATTIPPAASPFPSGGSLYAPPGGFTPNTSTPRSSATPQTIVNPTASAPPPNAPIAPPAQFAGASGATASPIRVLEPSRTSAGPVGTTVARPNALPAAAGGVDIMDLPVSNRPAQPQTAAAPGALQNFQQPAAAYPPGTSNVPVRTATLEPAQAAYGYNNDYTRLAGRLEYSPADGRWMLRYLAPGAATDRFGGVVLVAVQRAAAGLRPGDFVIADGRIDPSTTAAGYPPVFTAADVQPQRR